ncbi:MAG: hypothetical protein M1824_006138 [Vezdaea acicularis]|nr:MAG: hypothetical protein M1824_006138 [Vezdaea acicularis]
MENMNYRRKHNLLLISRLLCVRDHITPFALILDSLEQSGKPLQVDILRRASGLKIHIIFVAFETLKKPRDVTIYIWGRRKTLETLLSEIRDAIIGTGKCLIVFDSLSALAENPAQISTFLSTFHSPSLSLLATFHMDALIRSKDPYTPNPLITLKYLATTIFEVDSLHHVLARKAAQDRSLPEPTFGFARREEGLLISKGANDPRGVVVYLEYRRRSGRGVSESFFLPTLTEDVPWTPKEKERAMLLDDLPEYRASEVVADGGARRIGEEGVESTFSLGLTEKQRREREGVILPYFDAQKGDGEGGRILYDMGVEDDFDEEEDEI